MIRSQEEPRFAAFSQNDLPIGFNKTPNLGKLRAEIANGRGSHIVNQSGFTAIGKFCQAGSNEDQLRDLEEAATKLLENELDKSIQKFRAKNADFFGEYTNARMIIALGEHHEKKPEAPKPNP